MNNVLSHLKTTTPLWKIFEILTKISVLVVPDPHKIHEKRVKLSIWNDIQLELDREKIIQMEWYIYYRNIQ